MADEATGAEGQTMSERGKSEPAAPDEPASGDDAANDEQVGQPDAAAKDVALEAEAEPAEPAEDEDGEDDEEDDSDDAARGTRGAHERKASSGLQNFWRYVTQTYATADPRSLGLFRIALATLLFIDVARRWPDVEAHYSNTGWLTNHFALFRPMSDHLFSVYLAFSTPTEVKTLMAFQLLVCVLLAIGWRTRLMHVLSAILIVSINSRNIMLENGGWVVLNILTVWTMFLPLGRRFSVDAVLASLKARRETGMAALNDREDPPRDTRPVVSLAVAALIAQWVVIYYFNVVHKQGAEWRDGTAVYYFFQQDRMVTGLGAWLRDFLPVGAFRFMTFGALFVESSIALLLALPFRAPIARMIAWLLCISLHLSIDAVVQLGPFSWAMVTAFWVLIPREAWETLGPRIARRFPRRTLCIAADSGFWLSFARVVKRFDVLGTIEFRVVAPAELPEAERDREADDDEDEDRDSEPEARSAAEERSEAEERDDDADDEPEAASEEKRKVSRRPPRSRRSIPPGSLERDVAETLVVIDPTTGTRYLGLPALFRLFDAVPFGFFLLLPARFPGISGAIAKRLRRAAQHRDEADAYFEVEKLPGSAEVRPLPPSPARESVRQGFAYLREAAVFALVIACGSQVLQENRAVPKWLKPTHRPEWMTALVVYPRMFQGWSMFAPSPPRDDGRMVIDGVTKDGRKLDPLTGEAPSFEVQPPGGFRMNQIWGDFHRRIGEDRFGAYLEGVKEMLKHYHVISGKPENELKSFDMWFVNEQIPPPGQKRLPPTRRKILSWSGDEAAQPQPAKRKSGKH